MAIDIKTIINLLDYLEGEIKSIQESNITEEALEKEDSIFVDATKYRVQIAVEVTINIAEHIVAGLNLGKPEFARELFPLLVKENIIDEQLAEKLGKAVGLRNILVHLYKEVDPAILAYAATLGLNDLRDFAKAINEFIEEAVEGEVVEDPSASSGQREKKEK